ncbi:MAG: hypothetical protein K2X27_22855 [Candidatus Obscuribacterales bacterium]|nr:hypothetical protein [Candidatus Obscuribacterales bacterium]
MASPLRHDRGDTLIALRQLLCSSLDILAQIRSFVCDLKVSDTVVLFPWRSLVLYYLDCAGFTYKFSRHSMVISRFNTLAA